MPPLGLELRAALVVETLSEFEIELRCAVQSDEDVTWTLSWTVDGAAFEGAGTTTLTGDTVSVADAARGTAWTCAASYGDVSASASHTFDLGMAPKKGQVLQARLLYRGMPQKILNLLPEPALGPLPVVEMAKVSQTL